MMFTRSNIGKLRPSDLLLGDVKLASPPEIYAHARRLIDNPASTTKDLADVISRDPALTARLLRLANSAFFSLQNPIHDIAEAVNRIGLNTLQNLILATEVIRHFEGIPADLVDIYSFWRNSLRCAVLARTLDRTRPEPSDGETLFLGGLLHDIGHLVLYSRLPELSRKALLDHRHRDLPLQQAERLTIGFDYTEVGAALARQWELPRPIDAILAYHLNPAQGGPSSRDVAVVHIALAATRAASFTPEAITLALTRDPQIWELAALSPSEIDAALPEAIHAFNDALTLLH